MKLPGRTVPHLVLILAMPVFLYGCAIIDSTIKPELNGAVASSRLREKREIHLIVSEESETNIRQGVKKNGFGMDLSNIYIEQGPSQMLREALAIELKAAGFTVSGGGADTYPLLEVRIRRCFAEPEVGFFGADVYSVIEAELFMQVDEGHAFARRIKGIGKKFTMVWTDSFYEDSFVLAFEDFMMKAVPAIVELTEGRP